MDGRVANRESLVSPTRMVVGTILRLLSRWGRGLGLSHSRRQNWLRVFVDYPFWGCLKPKGNHPFFGQSPLLILTFRRPPPSGLLARGGKAAAHRPLEPKCLCPASVGHVVVGFERNPGSFRHRFYTFDLPKMVVPKIRKSSTSSVCGLLWPGQIQEVRKRAIQKPLVDE